MQIKRRLFLAISIVLVSFFSLNFSTSRVSGSGLVTNASLSPTWTTGIISDWIIAGIEVTDINNDGKTDIVTCSNYSAYVLNQTETGAYDTIWFSEYIGCKKIAVGDRDSDSIQEIYMVTYEGEVLVIDGHDFQRLGSIALPNHIVANDIEIADVDNDTHQEIIVVRPESTLVYDANTFSLEWQADGFGGNEVAVGNIDDQSTPEIVVNGDTGHILNASQQEQEWAYIGGFGIGMDLGDVDGDAREEIVYIYDWDNIVVLNGENQTTQWLLSNLGDLAAVNVSDVDGDSTSEVLVGNGQWGSITGYRGYDGAKLWSIPNPEHGVSVIGVGDADDDGSKEILWSAGLTSSGKDILAVGSWVSQTTEWISDDLDGPMFVSAGDIDVDGQNEIVLATRSTNSGYQGGTIRVYDGETHLLEWSTVIDNSFFNLSHLAVAQLDNDEALEILVGGNNWYDTRLKSYDGVTRSAEWLSPELGDNEPRALTTTNLDADAVSEIVIGLYSNKVLVINGASNIIQWESPVLDGQIQDLDVGDLDGNSVPDLAVLTYQGVYVYRTDTWAQTLHSSLLYGKKLAIANEDLLGSGELLINRSDSSIGNLLQAWEGISNTVLWTKSMDNFSLNDITVADLDTDGVQEITLVGSIYEDFSSRTFLGIASHANPFFWEYKKTGQPGVIQCAFPANADNDVQNEMLISSGNYIQVNEINAFPLEVQNTFLPLLSKPSPPRGIYGTVTENGLPAAGIALSLRFFNGVSWNTVANTTTASNGFYSFMGISSLSNGQYYYVLFQNPTNPSPNRLWTWHTRLLSAFQAGGEIHAGNFDLANISLISPSSGVQISLPNTFQWVPRPNSPTDTYEFNLYEPINRSPYFFTDPPLGYVGSYTLNNVPPNFQTNTDYVWEIWVYSPDGGYGISNELRVVRFSNTGFDTLETTPIMQTKIAPDLENRQSR